MNLPLPLFLAAIAVRTAIVLLVLVGGIRILGRRNIGELHMVDLLMVLLISNAVQNAITTGSGSLAVALVSAGVLLAIDHFTGILFVREPWLENQLGGEPTVIATDGQLDARLMRRLGLSEDDVLGAAREQGLSDLSKVHLAVLEDDGNISIIPQEPPK